MKKILGLLALLCLYACAPSTVVPIDANPFVHLEGAAPELDISDRSDVSIVTWNVLGLPDFLVATKPWKARIDAMADLIHEIDADVVVLQEVFEVELAKGLYERLKSRYAHACLHLNTNILAFSSGLAIFSKAPIGEFRFTPHPNSLGDDKWMSLGIADFCLLKPDGKIAAHITAGHFQGSSRHSWRQDITNQGHLRTYAQTRQEQSRAALHAGSHLPTSIPRYLCGDLNVDRLDLEYQESVLNPRKSTVQDPMPKEMRRIATSTSFFAHYKMLWRAHPTLPRNEVLQITKELVSIRDTLSPHLDSPFWQNVISEIDFDKFKEELANLQAHLDLTQPVQQHAWEHFASRSTKSVEDELSAYEKDNSTGQVTLSEILQVRALPIDEALDYILGFGQAAHVRDVKILSGYDVDQPEAALSDHHPIYAKLTIL